MTERPRRREMAQAAGSLAEAARSVSSWVRPGGQQRIDAYRGFGSSATGVLIEGRVLANPRAGSAQVGEHGLRSTGRMAGRFITTQVPEALVEVIYEGRSRRVVADGDGYFSAEFSSEVGAEFSAEFRATETQHSPTRWTVALMRSLDDEAGAGSWCMAEVLVVGLETETVVISDIDDTVLVNGHGDPARTILATMSGSELTRSAVPGAAAVYRLLCRPSPSDAVPEWPLFFVSSSPWNIYDLLIAFLAVHRFPTAVLRLRSIGLDPRLFSDRAHQAHKTDAIVDLLDRLPHVTAVLIGDSSLRDVDAFAQVIDERPGRVAGAFIRDIGDQERSERVRQIVDHRPVGSPPIRLIGQMSEILDVLGPNPS